MRAIAVVALLALASCTPRSPADERAGAPPPDAELDDGGDVPGDDTGTGVDELPDFGDTTGAFDGAQAWLDLMVEEDGIPGASVAVVMDGALVWASTSGVLRAGSDEPVTQNSAFLVCSVTKMMTAAALMSAADDGLVDLDAPVTDVVPYFHLDAPFDASSVTTRQLLTHTSGIPDFFESSCGGDDDSLSRWFRDNGGPLWAPAGRLFNYSNQGYALAGLVLEEATGQRFHAAMEQRVFAPAAMGDITFDVVRASAREHAVGSGVDFGEPVTTSPDTYQCGALAPAGLSWGSAIEVARFAEMLLADGGDVMSAAAAAEMQAAHVDTGGPVPFESYGFGLAQTRYNGKDVVWHDGGAPGFATTLWMIPSERFAVVVLENGNGDAVSLAALIANELLGLPQENFPLETTAPSTWARYEGTYVDDIVLGEIEVALDGDTLTATFAYDGATATLEHWGRDQFSFFFDGEYWLDATFFFDDAGDGSEPRAAYLATRAGVAARAD